MIVAEGIGQLVECLLLLSLGVEQHRHRARPIDIHLAVGPEVLVSAADAFLGYLYLLVGTRQVVISIANL